MKLYLLMLFPVFFISCQLDKYNSSNIFPDDSINDADIMDTDIMDTDITDIDAADTDMTDTDSTDTDTTDTDMTDTDMTDIDMTTDTDMTDTDMTDADMTDADMTDIDMTTDTDMTDTDSAVEIEVNEETTDIFETDDADIDTLPRGVVIFTFDDFLISGWEEAHENFFKHENIPVTFYISRVTNVKPSTAELNILSDFESFGHDLANHTISHTSAVKYVEENGVASYYNNEIQPVYDYSDTIGLNISNNVAYPFGSANSEIDEYMLQTTKTVRYYNGDNFMKTFSRDQQILDCFPIDAYYDENYGYYYGSSQMANLSALLDAAKEKDEAAILCGHIIASVAPEKYSGMLTTFSLLKKVAAMVKEKNMSFMTIDTYFADEILKK